MATLFLWVLALRVCWVGKSLSTIYGNPNSPQVDKLLFPNLYKLHNFYTLTFKIPCVFFYQTLQLLTKLEKSISQKIKVWKFEEVTIGSWSYLTENQPQKIAAAQSMGSMRL
jgi:hypothetical protein